MILFSDFKKRVRGKKGKNPRRGKRTKRGEIKPLSNKGGKPGGRRELFSEGQLSGELKRGRLRERTGG